MLLLPTIQKQQNSIRAVYIHTCTCVHTTYMTGYLLYIILCTGEYKLNMLRVQLLAIGDATALCTKFQALL